MDRDYADISCGNSNTTFDTRVGRMMDVDPKSLETEHPFRTIAESSNELHGTALLPEGNGKCDTTIHSRPFVISIGQYLINTGGSHIIQNLFFIGDLELKDDWRIMPGTLDQKIHTPITQLPFCYRGVSVYCKEIMQPGFVSLLTPSIQIGTSCHQNLQIVSHL